MIAFNFKRLGCVVLGCLCFPAWGGIKADKTLLNSESGIVTVSVSFATPMQGDLYLATLFNGQLFFFANEGKSFVPEVVAYIQNSKFSVDRPVLQLSHVGIPAGEYSIYQVVTQAGKTPLDFNNWIGGVNGLSELKLQINLPVEPLTPLVTSTPEPVVPVVEPTPAPVPTPTPAPIPTPAPVATTPPSSNVCTVSKSNLSDEKIEKDSGEDDEDDCKTPVSTGVTPNGKSLYQQYCATCHGSKPEVNANKVLKGKDVDTLREAIKKNKGGMGFLVSLSDADLKAIAAYLKTF